MARLALSELEAEGVEHHVALYISYDAPHSGVHVPHGMQHLKLKLDEWAAMTEADFVALDPGWEGVFALADLVGSSVAFDPNTIQGFPDPTTTQAQQMTLQGAADPEAFAGFADILEDAGFPNVRSIAVSNGNTQGVPNVQSVAAGEELFYFTGAKGNSAASVRGTFQVFMDSPGGLTFTSNVYYDGLLQNHDGGTKDATAPANLELYDHLSGGTLDYASLMLAAAEAEADTFHEPEFRAAAPSPTPFVPTISALGLPITTRDADLAGIVARGETPFDVVIAIGDLPGFPNNLDHNTVVLTSELLEEISAVMTCPLTTPGAEVDSNQNGVDDACETESEGGATFRNCNTGVSPTTGGLVLSLMAVFAVRKRSRDTSMSRRRGAALAAAWMTLLTGCQDKLPDGVLAVSQSPYLGELVSLGGATFQMGSSPSDPDAETDEFPQHEVTLSGFTIMKVEVTHQMYQALLGPSPGYENPNVVGPCMECPVHGVSWFDAQDVADAVSMVSAEEWRLPTEAEWEYAARGGEEFSYAGSDQPDRVAWTRNNASDTQPPCGLAPNGFGLCDMSGNVYEWVSDWYAEYGAEPSTDPLGPDDGEWRVARGGAVEADAAVARVARRTYRAPDYPYAYHTGFRLVRSDE